MPRVGKWQEPAVPNDPVDWFNYTKAGIRTKFLTGKFVKMLMDKYIIRNIDGTVAVWNGICYETGGEGGWDHVERLCLRYYDDCSERERKEVCKTLKLMLKDSESTADPRYIQFSNCVVDVIKFAEGSDDYVLEPSPELLITNVIPHAWDEDAYSPVMDAMLDRVSCGHADVRALIEEMFGATIYRKTISDKLFILLGKGGNGKSIIQKHLQQVIGKNNYESMSATSMARDFMRRQLAGKLACFDDDVASGFADGNVISFLKQVTSGAAVTADVKGLAPVKFRPYATLIYNANVMFALSHDDANDGFFRRILVIPFEAVFRASDDDYDPDIERKLDTPECYSYTLKLAVEALARVIGNKMQFTDCSAAHEIIDGMREDNDTVLAWIHDRGVKRFWFFTGVPSRDTKYRRPKANPGAHGGVWYDEIESRRATKIKMELKAPGGYENPYNDYLTWCYETGCKSVKERNFAMRACTHLDMKRGASVYGGNPWGNGKTGRPFLPKSGRFTVEEWEHVCEATDQHPSEEQVGYAPESFFVHKGDKTEFGITIQYEGVKTTGGPIIPLEEPDLEMVEASQIAVATPAKESVGSDDTDHVDGGDGDASER